MALVIGNKTYDLNTPGGTPSRTFSHTQDVGADGYLFVLVNMANVASVTGITYNGVALTKMATHYPASYSTEWTFWQLVAPATGANNVVVTLSGPQYNPMSTAVISATGCGGLGVTAWGDTNLSPREIAVSTLETTSKLLISGTSGNSDGTVLSGVTTPATTLETRLWNHNINNWAWGGLSSITLAATSYARVTASSACAIFVNEIKASGAVATKRRLIIT